MQAKRKEDEQCQEKVIRWDRHTRPHYEVWYMTLNQLNSGAGFWIRYSVVAPRHGDAAAFIWFASFVPDISGANVAVAVRNRMDQFSAENEPFSLQIGLCSLSERRMTGMLTTPDLPVTWDLFYETVTDPLQILPEVLYRTRWVRSKILTPHPFMLVGGKIQIGDRQFLFNGDPGQQGHLWGRRHADEWIWFHCSSFVQEDGSHLPGYVTGITAQQRLLGRLHLNPLSFGHLVWNENHIPIRPATAWRNRWRESWEWKGTCGEEDVTIMLSLPWKDMVLAEYVDPCGQRVFCHHTGKADCIVTFRAPHRAARFYRSLGLTHLEIGSHDIDPRVTRRVTFL